MSNRRVIDLSIQGIHLYEVKHEEGDVIMEHDHPFHEILYALDGEGQLTLDGKQLDFNKDHGVVIVPFSPHAVVSDSNLTILVLAFDAQLLDISVQKELLDVFFNVSSMIRLNPFLGSELRQLLRKMLFELSRGNPLNLLAMKLKLSELLLVLARAQQPSHVIDADSLRAEKLRLYIDSHYFEIMHSNDISVKLGMSTRHVNNIFKKQYSITPIQYLTEVRIEMAKKMLVETDKEIVCICFEVGFETLSSFYRMFKNYIQMSPNQYRVVHRVRSRNEQVLV
ncbi:helix-turn-helix transcriptional regulator [Paenibacillus alba]|uniref:AraC family transcriptional regulator n=1 Tax=Paenibacillus alba TaxID=1197127 RepID=UPI0015633D2B|nr:AraC family transcriptional regulator [Paenibacillus alba]NQX70346.1 helix-turn-helix transcriptional regulator [Paenibacillus alba]